MSVCTVEGAERASGGILEAAERKIEALRQSHGGTPPVGAPCYAELLGLLEEAEALATEKFGQRDSHPDRCECLGCRIRKAREMYAASHVGTGDGDSGENRKS
jgi:hypothetical protein